MPSLFHWLQPSVCRSLNVSKVVCNVKLNKYDTFCKDVFSTIHEISQNIFFSALSCLLHARDNQCCYLVRQYNTYLSKENFKACSRGLYNKAQQQVQYQILSNTLAGWQGSGRWSREALRHFSQISRSLSLPLIWFVSLSPSAISDRCCCLLEYTNLSSARPDPEMTVEIAL